MALSPIVVEVLNEIGSDDTSIDVQCYLLVEGPATVVVRADSAKHSLCHE